MSLSRVLLGLLGASLLMAGFLATPGAARADDDMKVVLIAIVANDRGKEVDKRLRCIADEVRKQHPELTSFKLATQNEKPVAIGKKEHFPLLESEKACVTIVEGPDKDGKVTLTVKLPSTGPLSYTTCCGKYWPLMSRYKTADDDTLLVAIMVKSCKGK
jgi:hypothetical protein